jgi:hypothetical protein
MKGLHYFKDIWDPRRVDFQAEVCVAKMNVDQRNDHALKSNCVDFFDNMCLK